MPATSASRPMYFPPAPFSLPDALACAGLVEDAYQQYQQWVNAGRPGPGAFQWQKPVTPGWTFTGPFWWKHRDLFVEHDEPFGFVAADGQGNGYLAFRGTESVEDWVVDIDAAQTDYTLASGMGRAHKGFFGVYQAMSAQVLAMVDTLAGIQRFFVTGHSLGGALSTMAVPDVVTNSAMKPSASLSVFHYNFASPRAGDPVFATQFDNALGVTTFRVVNTEDIVTTVPLPTIDLIVFKHVGTPVDYSAEYGSISGNHSMVDSYLYALNHPDAPESPDAPERVKKAMTATAASGGNLLARLLTLRR